MGSTGERLILGYQKSALTCGTHPAGGVWVKHLLQHPPARWLALVADDFWYSSMRRPSKAAAVRVQRDTATIAVTHSTEGGARNDRNTLAWQRLAALLRSLPADLE